MRFHDFGFELGAVDVPLLEMGSVIPYSCESCSFTCRLMEKLDCGHIYCNRCVVKLSERDEERYCLSCRTITAATSVQVDTVFVKGLPCRCPRCQGTFQVGTLRTHFIECLFGSEQTNTDRETAPTEPLKADPNAQSTSTITTNDERDPSSTSEVSGQTGSKSDGDSRHQRSATLTISHQSTGSYDFFINDDPVRYQSKPVTLDGITVCLVVEQHRTEQYSRGVRLYVDNWGSNPRTATFAVTCKDIHFMKSVDDEIMGRPTIPSSRSWRSFVKVSPQGTECPPAMFSNTRINMRDQSENEVSVVLDLIQ